jgi:prepilin-type N-terminal cleavage/methylation domain-containing protein
MRKQFTLIELLVVIAIIGILASMLIPNLKKARDKVHIAVCLNNIKQQALAMHMYVDDHNGDFPCVIFYTDYAGVGGSYGNSKKWAAAYDFPLNPYIEGSYEILHCPSDKGNSKWPDSRPTAWGFFGNSYIVQRSSGWNVSRFTNSRGPAPYLTLASDQPKIDAYDQHDKKVTFHKELLRSDRLWESPRNRWHGQKITDDRSVMGFMDGHAQFFSIWWKPSNTLPGGTDIERDGYY